MATSKNYKNADLEAQIVDEKAIHEKLPRTAQRR